MTSTAPMRMEYDPFSPEFQADPVPGVPVDARRGAGVLQREVELVGAVPVRGRPRGRARPADLPVVRGHRHRRHRQGPEPRPASCPTSTTPATTRSAPWSSRRCCPAASPSARTSVRGTVRRPDRRLAAPRHRRPGPGAGLADAERGVLRPARPARRPARRAASSSSAGCTSSRTASPTTPGSPPWPRPPPRASSPTSSTCCNERAPQPARGPGDPHRHRRDRRRAVRRRAHRRRLGGHGPDAGAVPRRRGEHRGADRHAVQAARREPGPARDPAGEPGADPGRRRGGDPASPRRCSWSGARRRARSRCTA